MCLFNDVEGNGNKKSHTQKRRRVCNLTEMKEDAGAAKGHIQACVPDSGVRVYSHYTPRLSELLLPRLLTCSPLISPTLPLCAWSSLGEVNVLLNLAGPQDGPQRNLHRCRYTHVRLISKCVTDHQYVKPNRLLLPDW